MCDVQQNVDFHHVRKITIMAVNEKRLNITEFDFDDVKDNSKLYRKIKQNLKTMILRFWYEYLTRRTYVQYSLSWV